MLIPIMTLHAAKSARKIPFYKTTILKKMYSANDKPLFSVEEALDD